MARNTWSVQAKRVMRWLRLGDPIFVHNGPTRQTREWTSPVPALRGLAQTPGFRSQALETRWGWAAVLPGPPISCSHVQAAGAFLPGNSQSSWAIKSARGHPGIQSGTLGRRLWARGQVCLRVIGGLEGVEPAGRGKSWLLQKRLRPIPRAPGTPRTGCAGPGPSTHRGSEARFIDALSFHPQVLL